MKLGKYIGHMDIFHSDGVEVLAQHDDILQVHAKTDDGKEFVVKGKRSDFYFVVPEDRIKLFKEV
jgi:hypothetical protein